MCMCVFVWVFVYACVYLCLSMCVYVCQATHVIGSLVQLEFSTVPILAAPD